MKMKLIFCEKKARKPLVSLEKNIAEHFCSAMMAGAGGFARLRTGPVAALTCHRHVIHYCSPSNPPYNEKNPKRQKPFEIFCLRWSKKISIPLDAKICGFQAKTE